MAYNKFSTGSVHFDNISGTILSLQSGEVWYDIDQQGIGGGQRLNIYNGANTYLTTIEDLEYVSGVLSGQIAATGTPTFQEIYDAGSNTLNLGSSGFLTISDNDNDLLVLNSSGSVSLVPGVNGGNVYIGSPSTSGNLTVYGDLTIVGDQTIIGSSTTVFYDNILLLNSGEAGSGVALGYAGVEIDRGLLDNAVQVFNETTDKWQIGYNSGTIPADLYGMQNIATENYVNTVSGDLYNQISGAVQNIIGVSGIVATENPTGIFTLSANTAYLATKAYVSGATLLTKTGSVSGTLFTGTPSKMATVTFSTPFPSANYSPAVISATANRSWTVESVTASSFVINANANKSLAGDIIYWIAIQHGETTL